MDVARLNFSHGTHETHGAAIASIRRAAAEAARPVAILQDLSGPKIRTGGLKGGAPLTLAAGDALRLVPGDFAGEPGRVSITYPNLAQVVRPGSTLLLDDGHIQLRVEAIEGLELQTTVVDGGQLGEHKGINAPGAALPAAGLTDKDAVDVRFGVSAGVDMVAMSFVQSAADIRQLKEALRQAGAPDVPIVAKLERPEGVDALEEILAECHAVMVARGDLGLELPLERVPRIQKEATRLARARGIPVIIATQVFESMRAEPRPTRAEVSDAANAVDDRVDAIMLAGETAAGSYPLRAVETLDRVIRDAESILPIGLVTVEPLHVQPEHARAICEAAVTLTASGGASAIVAVTRGGKTARVLSALRPPVPIFAATDREDIARRLMLRWGVVPVLTDLTGEVNAAASRIGDELVAAGHVQRGALLVLVSVTPDLARGPSNFLKLLRA
jgi:pyruvate kinase